MSTRIRVTGGPWPDRIGLAGEIVPQLRDEYPWHGRSNNEAIIFIPNDPYNGTNGKDWTCAIDRDDLEILGDDTS